MLTTQYSVMVPNEPGQLARLTDALSRAGVNLAGVLSVNHGAMACLKFLSEQSTRLRKQLESEGYRVSENEVFALELADGTEAFNHLASELASHRINILSCYGQLDERPARLILSVDQPEKAAPIVASAR